jgi:hypothetical protein
VVERRGAVKSTRIQTAAGVERRGDCGIDERLDSSRGREKDVDNDSERSCRIRFCGHRRDAQESTDGSLAERVETRLFPAQSL